MDAEQSQYPLSHRGSFSLTSPPPASLVSIINSLKELDESSDNDYQDLQVISPLKSTSYTLLVVYSKQHNNHFVMKLYRYIENKVSPYYLNEARFSSLKHPNIISLIKTLDELHVKENTEEFYASYILMELAKCDFCKIVSHRRFYKDEVLVRTYFRQLVEGLEYLHSLGYSHLDLKPDNLLLGQDFLLKITDFDISYQEEDDVVLGKGTSHYRAPELKNEKCKLPMMADIYSLGILLFIFRMGKHPYMEDKQVKGFDLQSLLLSDPATFWISFNNFFGGVSKLSKEFKDLFTSMTRKDPLKRATIKDIKGSRWYQGSVYSTSVLEYRMRFVN